MDTMKLLEQAQNAQETLTECAKILGVANYTDVLPRVQAMLQKKEKLEAEIEQLKLKLK